jgi:hypothetical protein
MIKVCPHCKRRLELRWRLPGPSGSLGSVLILKPSSLQVVCRNCGRVTLAKRRRRKLFCSNKCRAAYYQKIRQEFWRRYHWKRRSATGRR